MKQSMVGSLNSCHIFEQSIEGEEVHQFSGGRR